MKYHLLLMPVMLIHLLSCRSPQLDLPETRNFQDVAWDAVKPLNVPATSNLNLQPRGKRVIARFTDHMQTKRLVEVTMDRKTQKVVSVSDMRSRK